MTTRYTVYRGNIIACSFFLGAGYLFIAILMETINFHLWTFNSICVYWVYTLITIYYSIDITIKDIKKLRLYRKLKDKKDGKT